MTDNTNVVKRISMTLLMSIIAMIVNYAISFVLTPYITTHVGVDAYGFVSLAKTVSNYGIIITGCLNAFAARFITISYHEGNLKKSRAYFSSVVIANIALLLFVVVFEIFFIWKLDIFVKIPQELIYDVKVLFALDITNYMLIALANTFSASAYIKNRLDIIEIIKLVSYISEALILVILFSIFMPRIYYVGIALICSAGVLGIGNYWLCKKYTPELRVRTNEFSWKAVKDLVVSGIWNSINSVGNLLNSGLDLWVSNLMLSAISMGQLSIVKTVATIFSTLDQILVRPFYPHLLKNYSDNNYEGLINTFKFQIKFSGLVASLIFAGFIHFGQVYFKLWVPGQDALLLNRLAIVTVTCFLFEAIACPLLYTYTLTLKNRIPCIITVGSGLLNVLGMYVLIRFTSLGLYAVAGTTTVLGFITYCVFTPLYTCHCLKIRLWTFYPSIIRVFATSALMVLVLKVVSILYMPSTWIGLIGVIVIAGVVGVPVYYLAAFSGVEKRQILKRIIKR